MIFPQITLAGLFTPEGANWNDTATDPNSMKWTAAFTVYSSYPPLKASDLIQMFKDLGFRGRISDT
jgi:hypothetical protein